MNNDNIHILNPGSAAAGGRQLPFSVGAGEESFLAYPWGTIDGPLRFDVGTGPGVIVSQRVQYERSFNEILAMDPQRSAKTLFFPWFDQASPGVLVDNV